MNAPRMRNIRRAARTGIVVLVRGFTIVEMLMVVAIMALLTVGLAQIFRVTGDTVRAGKRLSNLNAYAAMVEKQIRADFKSITRDGFMVMRHRNAGGTAPNFTDENILLAPNDAAPRRRRVDEIVFFTTGDFTTARDPIYPTVQAKGTQARIYYGHGYRESPDADTYYDRLRLDDLNNNLNDNPKFGQPGPNRYASDWTLLRQQVVLSQPRSMVGIKLPTTLVDPAPVYQNGNPSEANCEDLDSRIQISLQPAASSIFRYLARVMPADLHPRFGNAYVVRDDNSGSRPARPQFASGIVDVCAMDLTEIRAILLDAQQLDNRALAQGFSLDDDFAGGSIGGRDDEVRGSFFFNDLNPGAANSSTRLMQAWMREALPANSDAGERVRYELTPPNLLGNIESPSGNVYDKDYYRSDQMMLTASNFVPGCTEFIVEWSFGKAYPSTDTQGRAGQLIWHGLERRAGVTSTGQAAYAALPYGDPISNNADLYQMPYRRMDGTTGYWPPLPDEDTTTVANPAPGVRHNVNLLRIYNPFGGSNTPEYSYFGYVDPSYRMRSLWTDSDGDGFFDSGEAYEDLNNNGRRDTSPAEIAEAIIGNGDMWYDPNVNGERPDPREPGSIPWAWPRLVRFTISLADPTDPLREQTFQFVVEIPEGQGNVN